MQSEGLDYNINAQWAGMRLLFRPSTVMHLPNINAKHQHRSNLTVVRTVLVGEHGFHGCAGKHAYTSLYQRQLFIRYSLSKMQSESESNGSDGPLSCSGMELRDSTARFFMPKTNSLTLQLSNTDRHCCIFSRHSIERVRSRRRHEMPPHSPSSPF